MPKANVDRERTTIYALVDPRTDLPFYVGSTWARLKTRLMQHVTGCLDGHLLYSPKEQRIREIKAAGLYPSIVVLADCPTAERAEVERYWVEFLRKEGADLTNASNAYNPVYATRKRGFWNIE